METQIDYSNNSNDIFTNDQLNNFFAANSENLVNNDRVFNQLTSNAYDSCDYNNKLKLSTKPLNYYINSLNNISGLDNNEQYLAFTPIGNAATQNISNLFDRSLPTNLNRLSSVYTLNYSTSPFLGASNNINTLDTDTDLTLKTGLGLRNKNNQAQLSAKNFPHYGDIHGDDIGVTVQNFGQYSPDNIQQSINPNIPGLNESQNQVVAGLIHDPSRLSISTTVANKNYLSLQNNKK